jgi:cytochrome c-type biogenesis protein CcmH
MKSRFLAILMFFLIQGSAFGGTLYPFASAKQEAQFHKLLRDLRCLVCQNQNLVDSNAELARDLKLKVYQMVKEGQSDADIIHYLTERYGDFILFKPPVKTITLLLWCGPALFLMLGLLIFWQISFRQVTYE